MIRQLSTNATLLKSAENAKIRLELILKSNPFIGSLCKRFVGVPRSLKDHSASVLRVWAHQCECVFAQRLRRGQQMFSLYSRLWEEQRLRDFLRRFRGRNWLAGAVGAGAFDWAANRIPEAEVRQHRNEFEYVYKLREKTLCEKCEKSSRICSCDAPTSEQGPKLSSYDEWKVFITKPEMVVWRRLHPTGCYEYKVFGSYNDVTAEDFLNVQIDIEYRKQWDATAVALNVVEQDPQQGSNSDIVYWEMLWPTLFANRDYVFNRRYLVDHKAKTLYLVSKSTKHPSCPKNKTKYRIEDYWSYMVIKPYTELNEQGIEFSLTYFDNPGVNIPASVTTWVAMKAMPDFLDRLRVASKRYRVYCQESGVCQICNIMEMLHEQPEIDVPPTEGFSYIDEDIVTDNTIYEPSYLTKKFEFVKENPPERPPEGNRETEIVKSEVNAPQPESSSYWRDEEVVAANPDIGM